MMAESIRGLGSDSPPLCAEVADVTAFPKTHRLPVPKEWVLMHTIQTPQQGVRAPKNLCSGVVHIYPEGARRK